MSADLSFFKKELSLILPKENKVSKEEWIFYFLVSQCHLSYDDIMNTPIPFIISLMDCNIEENKRIKKK